MKSFEQRLKELEEINEQLKSQDTPLQEAITLFEQAVRLSSGLEQELQEAQRRVDILLQGDNLTPFENQEDNG